MRLFLPFFRVASIALLLLSVLMLVPTAYGVLGSGRERSAFYWPLFITLAADLLATTDMGITGASTALMNVGPGLGSKIGPSGHFKAISNTAKCILVVGMIMGRLEFTAILIIFTRTFWRA